MMKRLLRILLIAGIIAFAVFIAGASAIYLKYKSVASLNIPIKHLKTELQPGEEVALGEPLKVTITLRAPWDKYPSDVQIIPSQGSQLYGLPEIIKEKREWGYTLWKICLNLQAFSTGLIPEGSLKIASYSHHSQNVDSLSLKIPEFKSLEIKNTSGNLNIAGKVSIQKFAEKSKVIYFIIASAVIVIALILFLLFRKKKANIKILSSWEKAIVSLNKLKGDYHSGTLNPLKCISLLTDIVRDYLEERFKIHAPKQTTYEFLSSMEDPSSPLNNKDRNFLREFLVSADMIKFAKYDADKDMIENSMNRAVQLVTESIPDQNSDKEISEQSTVI